MDDKTIIVFGDLSDIDIYLISIEYGKWVMITYIQRGQNDIRLWLRPHWKSLVSTEQVVLFHA